MRKSALIIVIIIVIVISVLMLIDQYACLRKEKTIYEKILVNTNFTSILSTGMLAISLYGMMK